MVGNSLNFCLCIKLLISPSNLNVVLSKRLILVVTFFFPIILSIFCHSFLSSRVSVEILAVSLMGIPLYVICSFSLATVLICV